MNCKHYYKNILFNSEIELDDFLLSGGDKLLDKYGDTVFQEHTLSQLNTIDQLEPIVRKSKDYKNYNSVRSYNKQSQSTEIIDKTRTQVTKFLSGLRIEGKLIFPEFIEENYFNTRIESWRNSTGKRFTEKELADFAEEPEFKDGNTPSIMTQELIDRLIKIEKEKWEHEAKVGTAIHNLCEIFFSRQSLKDNNFSIFGDLDSNHILNIFKKRALPETKALLSEKQMKQVIDYCKKLKVTIESTYDPKGTGHFLYFPELSLRTTAHDPSKNENVNLSGMIDLLVVPPEGDAFIIDYKVSPADYWREAESDIAVEDLAPDEYSSAKKRAFTYQLATYARMLRKINPTFRNISVLVAPIQLVGYTRTDGNWNFKNIETNKPLIDDLTKNEVSYNHIQDNIDTIFVDVAIAQLDDQDILKKIKNTLLGWFTAYKSKEISWSVKDIQEFIEDPNHKYEENPDAEDIEQKFSYKVREKTIYGKSKLDLISKIQAYLSQCERRVGTSAKNFKEAVHNQTELTINTSNRLEHQDGDAQWYDKVIRKYTRNGQYEVIGYGDSGEIPAVLEAMGIVLLKNKYTKNIEVIKFTHERTDGQVDRRNVNKLITQALGINDIVDKAGEATLLNAVHGNVAMIETLLALNFVPTEIFKGSKIHSIKVINPFLNSGLTASNKQLLNSFKILNKYKNIDKEFGPNRINYSGHKGDIKFCTMAEQALDTLRTGTKIVENDRQGRNLKVNNLIVNKCLTPIENLFLNKNNEIDIVGNDQGKPLGSMAEVLYEAIRSMESIREGIAGKELQRLDFDVTDDEIDMQYQMLHRAYAEELGYDFEQQIEAYDNWRDSNNVLLKGHSGLKTDNPGTTASKNLNKITEFIDNCYKRVTDSMQKPHALVQKMVIELKKENKISYLGDSTFQNSVRIYENMTNYKTRKPDEDWVFVNPYANNTRLSATERKFLKYVIKIINSNRFKKRGETDIAFETRMIQELEKGNLAWLRVPLSYKGTAGKLETEGLLAAAKDYFLSWKWNVVKDRIKKEMGHLLTPEGKQLRDDLYVMRTRFDQGEDPRQRAELLKDLSLYDHDLQSIFLKHLFAYKMKEESEKAFTLIKAAHADLIFQEFSQNIKREAELEYLKDNVLLMLGRKVMDDKDLQIYEYAQKIMHLASVVTLGFNPKQIYQLLEGIYKDIGIIWRNEDGRFGFTLTEMVASFVDVYKEMTKFGYRPTKLERLNQLYRINDMDINVYAEHLQNSHNIFRNTNSFIFRFASRPDFYNRMTIFESYMRHDGTYEAHYLNEDGELIYDFNLDPRFSTLVKGDVNNPKYREQEALYRAMAKQFEIEGAIYPDGTKFKLEPPKKGVYKPLPQAYTNKQARSYKSMADKLYGYYSHEKRALMQASLLGALFWQMNTYWSGKKNQWFAISSVKDRGWFTHYSEIALDEQGKPIIKDGKEVRNYYYYQVDNNGNILFDQPPVTKEELINKSILVPFYQWEGSFSEGIIVTLSSMVNDAIALGLNNRAGLIQPVGSTYDSLKDANGNYTRNPTEIINAVKNQYWNNTNENLRTAYRQNIRQFAYDIAILTILGSLVGGQIHTFVNTYTKDHKDDRSVQQAMANSAFALSEAIFDASVLDFNPLESIGGRGVNWTPFAISTITRALHVLSRVITGDDTITDGFLKMFSANRFTLIPFIKQRTDPEVQREQRQELKEQIEDHEGIEPTQEEQRNAVAEAMTLMSLSPIYTQ